MKYEIFLPHVRSTKEQRNELFKAAKQINVVPGEFIRRSIDLAFEFLRVRGYLYPKRKGGEGHGRRK